MWDREECSFIFVMAECEGEREEGRVVSVRDVYRKEAPHKKTIAHTQFLEGMRHDASLFTACT
jgi:hypothetical protein